MNVEELIRKDYEDGATYRQLAKKYRKSFTQIARILRADGEGENDGRSGTLERRILELEREIQMLRSSIVARNGSDKREEDIKELLEIKKMLEISLNNRFRRDLGWTCVRMTDDGYCTSFFWKSPIKGWDMKKERGVYFLRVEKHKSMCAFCPAYFPSRLADFLTSMMRGQNEMLAVMLRLLDQCSRERGDAGSFERK
ncbi:MAG: hypothetical protein QHH00_04210 [Methanomassiliicoccales archaeon]|jgi:hypothetical protein|nr:hypothetical protein [Methanomassiliicoccales archaeon]